MQAYPLPKVFHLIEPGPVVLVSTSHKGKANLMTMSWHMMVEFDPPLIACVIGPWDHSFEALRATRECVLAIPGVDLAPKVVDIGNCSGRDVDKFGRFGLTPRPARKVAPPLVAECLANIECTVQSLIRKYGIVLLKAVKAWKDPSRREQRIFHARGDGTFAVDGRILDLRKKMTKFPEML